MKQIINCSVIFNNQTEISAVIFQKCVAFNQPYLRNLRILSNAIRNKEQLARA